MSCAPHLVQDGDQDQHQPAPNEYDFLFTIVSDDGYIVLDVWIAIEKLMSPAKDENAAKQKDDHRDGECDAECRNAGLFNHPNERDYLVTNSRVHLDPRSVGRTQSCLSSPMMIVMMRSGG
jgi:hypothetical protein